MVQQQYSTLVMAEHFLSHTDKVTFNLNLHRLRSVCGGVRFFGEM